MVSLSQGLGGTRVILLLLTHEPRKVAANHLHPCALARLRSTVPDAPYNVVFHTAPHHHDQPFHWHVHVLPRLTSAAGFEQGTGVMINIVAPETAAAQLRSAVGHC